MATLLTILANIHGWVRILVVQTSLVLHLTVESYMVIYAPNSYTYYYY